MAKKLGIRHLTEFVVGCGRLAVIGAVGLIGMLSLLLVGNFMLHCVARVVDALLDLLENGIFGGT